MPNPTISIIVPVYNVEHYLDRCVESLVNQTFDDLEIILVDDGSPDGSAGLCDAWEQRDSRVRAFHKANGGLSDARNFGVGKARGDFIGFFDSDDYAKPTMYEVLHRDIVKEGADIAICEISHVYADKTVEPEGSTYLVVDAQTAIEFCLDDTKGSVNAVNRLYRKEIAQAVEFPKGRATEDGFTVVEFLMRCDKVVYDSAPLYCYEHHEGTLSSMAYCARKWDVIDAYEHNRELIASRFPELLELAEFRCYWARFFVLDSMFVPTAEKDEERKKEIVSYLRSHSRKILANRYVGRARKISLRALMVSVPLYGVFAKAHASRRKYV